MYLQTESATRSGGKISQALVSPGARIVEGFADRPSIQPWRAGACGTPAWSDITALRFQVYCSECNFIEAADHPDGHESDAYDARSAHFAVADAQAAPVAYGRLVLADQVGRLPFEVHGLERHPSVALMPRSECAEVSRLIVHSRYRRRLTDGLLGLPCEADPAPVHGDRRSDSRSLLLDLYRQMYAFSGQRGIRYWYAAMERPLARVLTSAGFPFRQIGPVADYFGLVAPFMADLRQVEASLAATNPALLAWFQKPGTQLDS